MMGKNVWLGEGKGRGMTLNLAHYLHVHLQVGVADPAGSEAEGDRVAGADAFARDGPAGGPSHHARPLAGTGCPGRSGRPNRGAPGTVPKRGPAWRCREKAL